MFGVRGIDTPSNSIEILGHNMLILAGQIGKNEIYIYILLEYRDYFSQIKQLARICG